MTGPVRWADSVVAMMDAGVTAFVEVGPGGVLAKLIRRTAPAAAAVSVGRPDDIATALQTM
jgi:[acyl-carrier-protein] S-malonyltransferase